MNTSANLAQTVTFSSQSGGATITANLFLSRIGCSVTGRLENISPVVNNTVNSYLTGNIILPKPFMTPTQEVGFYFTATNTQIPSNLIQFRLAITPTGQIYIKPSAGAIGAATSLTFDNIGFGYSVNV